MDGLFALSGSPAHPNASLSLPFQSSFGAPKPPTTTLSVPFGNVSGDLKTGPYKQINRSITQHFIASYNHSNAHTQGSFKSPLERLNRIDVGDFVFSDSTTTFNENSPSMVEFYTLGEVNDYLRDNPQEFEDCTAVKSRFLFTGVVKNTVEPNGSTAYPRTNMRNRMLNVVVSQKASARNVFRYKMLSGQKLWFVIVKKQLEKSTGKRSATEMERGGYGHYFEIRPWTQPCSDFPRPKDMLELGIPLTNYRNCLIYVGRVAESSFNDMLGAEGLQKKMDMKKLELFVKI